MQVATERLKPWPGNPRRGDAGRIRESILEHGVYKPLLVQAKTGYIMAGNNVWAVARELGIEEIGVVFMDVDDETARKIVLIDNRSSDGGEYDAGLLRAMLEAVGDYRGTGYEREDVLALMKAAAEEETQYLEALLEHDNAPEEVFVLDEVRTGAAWAELPQQEAARAERQAAQMPSTVKGVREIMLVYLVEEHEEMIRLLDGLRRSMGGGGELRYPQIVQQLVRDAARKAGLL
jgi:ParB-like chromosome segregation protein Spo0J